MKCIICHQSDADGLIQLSSNEWSHERVRVKRGVYEGISGDVVSRVPRADSLTVSLDESDKFPGAWIDVVCLVSDLECL